LTSPTTSAQFTGFTGIKVQIQTRGACCSGCQAALLLLYYCFTAALAPAAAAAKLLYCCFTAALLLLCCCFTDAWRLLQRLPRLHTLDLSHNLLSGTLPPLAPEGVPLSLYLLYYYHASSSPTTSSSLASSLFSRKVLYCCFTAALLLLYCCFTAALLLLYCCFTAAISGTLPPLAPEGVSLSLYLRYYSHKSTHADLAR
jgi:hypothetical protein